MQGEETGDPAGLACAGSHAEEQAAERCQADATGMRPGNQQQSADEAAGVP